ncbi:MAG: radical SAM protein [Melioribacteraceae bacterium]|nr:radical SAM protein [Melioribacteraceae bacterium]
MFSDITQIIPTIQGEGPKVGIPSLLIRWRACNLDCPFCDTQWTNKHTDDELGWNVIRTYLERFPKIDNIMFTGGEPFLYTTEISELINEIDNEFDQIKTIEIESNGTLITEENMTKLLSSVRSGRFKTTINVSPKLGPECYRETRTPDSIINMYKRTLAPLNRLAGGKTFDYIFKVVYSEAWKENIVRFLDEVKPMRDRRKPVHRVYMMPITPDFRNYGPFDEDKFINDFRVSCNETIQFCLEQGLKYSCREHVWIWYDKKNELVEVNR